jgi:putative ABC transport system permease protein
MVQVLFVRLHKGADGNAFSDKIEDFIVQRNEGSNVQLFAYPKGPLPIWKFQRRITARR